MNVLENCQYIVVGLGKSLYMRNKHGSVTFFFGFLTGCLQYCPPARFLSYRILSGSVSVHLQLDFTILRLLFEVR